MYNADILVLGVQVVRVRPPLVVLSRLLLKLYLLTPWGVGGGGGYSHIVWVGCAAGFAKVLPFTRPNFANFVTLYQT